VSIKADDIEIGKCYTTTMQSKPSIVKVIDIAGTAVEITENAGRPGASTTVQKNRHVKKIDM